MSAARAPQDDMGGPLDRWVASHAPIIEFGGRLGYWLSDDDVDAFDAHQRLPEQRTDLRDLAERLTGAAATLGMLLPSDPAEQARLSGKAEGVRLALSYVEETLR